MVREIPKVKDETSRSHTSPGSSLSSLPTWVTSARRHSSHPASTSKSIPFLPPSHVFTTSTLRLFTSPTPNLYLIKLVRLITSTHTHHISVHFSDLTTHPSCVITLDIDYPDDSDCDGDCDNGIPASHPPRSPFACQLEMGRKMISNNTHCTTTFPSHWKFTHLAEWPEE